MDEFVWISSYYHRNVNFYGISSLYVNVNTATATQLQDNVTFNGVRLSISNDGSNYTIKARVTGIYHIVSIDKYSITEKTVKAGETIPSLTLNLPNHSLIHKQW